MLKILQLLPQTSLRNQLFTWLFILLLPLVFISAFASYYLANHFTNLTYDKSLYRTALALADQVSLESIGVELILPQVAKDLIEFDEDDDVYFRIIGPKGDLISSHTSLPLPQSFPKADKKIYYNTLLKGNRIRVVVYALPMSAESNINHPLNNVFVMVGETLQKRARMKNEIIISMLLPQLLILLLVGSLLFLGIKRGLQSLEAIKVNLSHRNINDLNPIDNLHAPKELQPLFNAFNELLVRVSGSITKQQRFIADAAHQLKTPLAGLKTQAELALRENDTLKKTHALQQINHASGNLSHMINQLLTLTKAGPENAALMDVKPVNLCLLAQQVCTDWVGTAISKKIDLGYESKLQNALIEGNEVLLRELMNNLIDNAIRYTPVGGQITVGIQQENSTIIYFVKDSGVGILAENHARIFERFYRVLGSGQEGCGLGLTIVQEIAERHAATITVLSEGDGKGAIFQVKFKLVQV